MRSVWPWERDPGPGPLSVLIGNWRAKENAKHVRYGVFGFSPGLPCWFFGFSFSASGASTIR